MEKSKWKFYRISEKHSRSVTSCRETVEKILQYHRSSVFVFFHGEVAPLLKGRKSADTYVATPFTHVLKSMGGKRGHDRQTMGCGRNIALLQ
jgi:hypothetical protein